jgi:arabinogalactan endo-1,4-beta-galactosidase
MSETIPLTNPGFEMSEPDGSPTGWTSTGAVEAVIIEDRGHTGEFRLTQKAEQTYLVETSQTVQGLTNGWYTMGAWVRSSGEQKEVYIALDCNGNEKRTYVPATTPGYRWVRLVVSNQVTDDNCTVRLHSDANPENWASFDDIELVPGQAMLSILGADVSSLKKSEDMGGVYKYSDGTQADALKILKDNGLNYVASGYGDPPDGYHDKEELLVWQRDQRPGY